VDEPIYILTVIHIEKEGAGRLERRIYISREDLSIQKQVFFDRAGNIDTVGIYNNYSMEGDVMFPHIIRIERPKEQYAMQLGMVKVQLNVPLTNEQFDLPRPEGSDLQVLDNVRTNEPPKGGGSPKNNNNRNR
jgi:hypothetical protein